MKVIPSVVAIIGVIFVVLGTIAPTVAPLQVATAGGGGGGGGGSYDYMWSVSGSLASSPSTVDAGKSVILTIDVTSYANYGGGGADSLLWYVNGTVVYGTTIAGTGSVSYTYDPTAGSYSWHAEYISEESSSGGTKYSSFGSSSFYVQPVYNPPTITSISSSQNPSLAGQTVSFSASINWGGQVGTVSWLVNGNSISGSSYKFLDPGTYDIEAYVQNTIGSASDTLSQQVNPQPTTNTTNTTNTNPENVGSFYYASGNAFIQMTNSMNSTISIKNASIKLVFAYVLTDGTTKNVASYYLSVFNINTGNTTQLKIWSTNYSQVNDQPAYYVITSLGIGNYVITGFVVPSNGNPALNIVSSHLNIESQLTSKTNTYNYVDIGVGSFMILVAILIWRRLP